ncbi:MAG: hypothetical protein QG583_361 [Patescibacteria group bacterium]|nr:hypothetical protein [Patescibacteria group bacterium]
MNYKSSSQLFSWYYVVIIVIILLVGIFATFYTYKDVSNNTQKTLLKDVASMAVAFNIDDIMNLTGTPLDLTSPVYLSLKNKLETIRATNEEVRFVYFLGYRNDQVFFYLDSEPDTSEDYSPPGQVYDEATDLDIEILKGEKGEGIEFSTDRWGSWLTSLVSIKHEGQVIAVLGMDMSADRYFRNLYTHLAIPIISTIFVLILIFIGLLLRRKEKEYISFKEKLFSLATHDLRSPLTGISWLTETTLMNKEGMRKEDMQNIEQIHEKVKTLLNSVNTLLASTDERKVKDKK